MFALKVHTAGEEDSQDDSNKDNAFLDLANFEKEWKTQRKSGTDSIRFSTGNPRVEAARGVVHLFRDTSEKPGTFDKLPEGRTEDLCVLAVPKYMTGADFCRFTGAFLDNIKEIRVVRNDAVEDRYMVLLKFDGQPSADDFYRHYNGRLFSSMEAEACHVLFTADVHYTDSEDQAATPPAGLTELPSCPVCLERLDKHISGILTTVCNHSFHSSCISKWADSSCPVCRYCQEQPNQSTCTVCGARENLWICLICGFVGCGRYQQGHGISHWRDTQHCYSLELETQRVWDYVGDGYVHRLIQSKTDGKLVELPAPCSAPGPGGGGGAGASPGGMRSECSGGGGRGGRCSHHAADDDSDIHEAVLNSKFEAVAHEYNQLLTSQLDSQRQYFEGLLAEAAKERDDALLKAVENSTSMKLQKLQDRLARVEKEKEFLRQVNDSLIKNQKQYQQRLKDSDERETKVREEHSSKVADLEEQVRDLMVYIEAQRILESSADAAELKDGSLLAMPEPEPAPAPAASGKSKQRANRRQR